MKIVENYKEIICNISFKDLINNHNMEYYENDIFTIKQICKNTFGYKSIFSFIGKEFKIKLLFLINVNNNIEFLDEGNYDYLLDFNINTGHIFVDDRNKKILKLLPKNIFDWTEEEFFYFSLKTS